MTSGQQLPQDRSCPSQVGNSGTSRACLTQWGLRCSFLMMPSSEWTSFAGTEPTVGTNSELSWVESRPHGIPNKWPVNLPLFSILIFLNRQILCHKFIQTIIKNYNTSLLMSTQSSDLFWLKIYMILRLLMNLNKVPPASSH